MRSITAQHTTEIYENGKKIRRVDWTQREDPPWPLPDEFQPPPDDDSSPLRTAKANFTSAEDIDSLYDERKGEATKKAKQGPRYWETGYYLFYTKTYAGTRSHHFFPLYWDKIVTPRQNKEWQEFQRWAAQKSHNDSASSPSGAQNHPSSSASSPTPEPASSSASAPPPAPPRPSQQSTLTHISSFALFTSPLDMIRQTIPDALRPVTTPTSRLLEITRDVIGSGEMKEFFKRVRI